MNCAKIDELRWQTLYFNFKLFLKKSVHPKIIKSRHTMVHQYCLKSFSKYATLQAIIFNYLISCTTKHFAIHLKAIIKRTIIDIFLHFLGQLMSKCFHLQCGIVRIILAQNFYCESGVVKCDYTSIKNKLFIVYFLQFKPRIHRRYYVPV